MKRKIYEKLLEWKNDTKNVNPLIVFGARLVGKTYIINDFCQNEYKNFIHVNLLEDDRIVNLYDSDLNSEEKLAQLKVILNFDIDKDDCILFIDEIQQSEKLISELKFFCEKHNNIRIICAGSLLGVKLKRSKTSFPVGKVKMITMYPMDFEEFLWAMKEELLLEYIKDTYNNKKKMSSELHQKALRLYKTYLITGGMPESIQNMVDINGDYIKYDKTILENILEAYFNDMKKYVISENEVLKIRKVYNSLPSQLANQSKKFQYSKIDKNAKSRDFESPIDWLIASNLVHKAKCVKIPEIPLEGFVDDDTFKLYLSDIGILENILKIRIEDILNDNLSLYKGVIAENYVANHLTYNGYSLYYWKNNNEAEIDFLINNKDGIIPIEVKASINTKSKSLNVYKDTYNPPYAIRISTKEFGYDKKNKIKSIPLYAVFLL